MKVTFESFKETHHIEPMPGERLLYCGLRHGIKLPYECASGTCSTCRAQLISGEVESYWPDAPGSKTLRPARNEFLMCQSMAKSDLTIKVRPGPPSVVPLPVPQILHGEISNFQLLNDQVAVFDYELDSPIDYLPGQFITVSVDGIDGYRAYSMTDHHELPTSSLPFLVKRMPNGKFTDWLFNECRDGTQLQGFGPLGRAIFSSDLDEDYVALVGGTGIAGIMAIIQNSIRCGHLENHNATLIFGLNRVEDAFFLSELHNFCEEIQNFAVVIALTDMSGYEALQSSFPLFKFAQGFLHEASERVLQDLSNVSVAFVAGPPVAVDASRMMLFKEKKFSFRKIRYDRFG